MMISRGVHGLGAAFAPQLGSTADIYNKLAIWSAWQQVTYAYPHDQTAINAEKVASAQYNQAGVFQWPPGTAASVSPAPAPNIGFPSASTYPNARDVLASIAHDIGAEMVTLPATAQGPNTDYLVAAFHSAPQPPAVVVQTAPPPVAPPAPAPIIAKPSTPAVVVPVPAPPSAAVRATFTTPPPAKAASFVLPAGIALLLFL